MSKEQPEALRAQIGQGDPDDVAAKERDRILSALKRHDWHSSNIWRYYYPSSTGDWVDLRELRKMLASAPPAPQAAGLQHEPLACAQVVSMNDVQGVVEWLPHHGKPIKVGDFLYSAPQQQPLTDEQIQAIYDECDKKSDGGNEFMLMFARAIEAAHNIGEKE